MRTHLASLVFLVFSVFLVAFIALPALPARAAVDKNSAALVTELVTTSLDKEQRFEVLSSSDVRRQLEIEANKATLGCDADSSSCLAEIAGAMGAQLVVYGKLGTLDDVVILTLNLFDSAQAKAVGRVALKEKSLSALSDRVDGGVKELIAPFTAKLATSPDGAGGAGAARMKLLVLDIEPPDTGGTSGSAAAGASAAPSEPMSALFWGGVGGLAGGAVVGVVGALFLVFADGANKVAKGPGVDAIEADAAYDERDTFGALGLGGVGVGVVVLGAGAVMLGLSLTE